jgi:hypothetical protein
MTLGKRRKAMPETIEPYNRLKQIDIEIKEAKRRLPAHSVKPVLMIALFELEDERDAILKQLKTRPPCPDGSALCRQP